MDASQLPQTKAALEFIIEHYRLYTKSSRKLSASTATHQPHRPLVVGVSGCQGSGKTTLCHTLVSLLREAGYKVTSFSLDDLYLTRVDQMALAQRYPGNALLQLRGQPGSHDLQLARQTFAGLMTGQPTAIPAYDKSLHSGLGDRRPRSEWTVVEDSLDILLFEGWSLGFKALSMDRLRSIYSQSPLLQRHSLDHLVTINQFLSQYEDDVYPAIDIFLHLTPTDLDYVYQWRLQQEHHMKATRDVSGLSDEAVRAFVDTYMPAYVMYLGHLEKYGFFGAPDSALLRSYEGWQRHDGHYDNNQFARHLRFRLDKHRQVVATTPIFPTKRSSSVPDSRAPAYPWLRPSLLAVTTCAIGLISWSLYHHQRRQVQ